MKPNLICDRYNFYIIAYNQYLTAIIANIYWDIPPLIGDKRRAQHRQALLPYLHLLRLSFLPTSVMAPSETTTNKKTIPRILSGSMVWVKGSISLLFSLLHLFCSFLACPVLLSAHRATAPCPFTRNPAPYPFFNQRPPLFTGAYIAPGHAAANILPPLFHQLPVCASNDLLTISNNRAW